MTVNYTMSNDEYHKLPSISASAVKTVVQKSLAHWKYGQRKESAAFDLGVAVHTLILEPHMASTVWCGPETRRGNEWRDKKVAADAEGAILLPEGEYRQAKDMAEAVRANAEAAQLLSGDLVCEASIFAHDALYGLDLRCRPDGWRRDIDAIIDVKTTVDASPEGFAKQVASLGYHIQEAFYRRVMQLSGRDVDRFVFIAIEKEPPFAVGVYELDWASRDEGAAAVRAGLDLIQTANTSGEYSTGYGALQTLQIPRWSFRFTQPSG
jgi:hypothetical protein